MMNMIKAAIPVLAAISMLCAVTPRASAAGADESGGLIGSLGEAPLSSDQLAKLRGGALGSAAINIGVDTNNKVINSPTGAINNNQSANNNTGLTTIMQNTGNNALLQSSMTVNITVH